MGDKPGTEQVAHASRRADDCRCSNEQLAKNFRHWFFALENAG
jgi:hypothetical protein